MGEFVILLLSILIIITSIMVLVSRTAISSALSLVAMMVLLAGLYAVIGAHFVAALQLIVYAGAIMVLFIFSIMLLNFNDEAEQSRWNSTKFIVGAIGGFLLMATLFMAFTTSSISFMAQKGPFSTSAVKTYGGNVQALSEYLFSDFYLHFELLSLVILVAVIGTMVVAKKKS